MENEIIDVIKFAMKKENRVRAAIEVIFCLIIAGSMFYLIIR